MSVGIVCSVGCGLFLLSLFAELVVVCFCCHCMMSWLWSVSVVIVCRVGCGLFLLLLFAELVVVCCHCLLSWLWCVVIVC